MKKIILKTTAILLILAGVVACEKENTNNVDFREITIGSANPVINYAANGIEFEFCLLNEQGEPSTIFNEGENFSFYFKIANRNNDGLQISKGFLNNLVFNGFSQVISADKKIIGYPLISGICSNEFRLYPFYGEYNICELTVPWNYKYEGWDADFLCYESLPQKNLPKGKYYTGFSHTFVFYTKEYNHDNQDRVIKISVSCKINFEIK